MFNCDVCGDEAGAGWADLAPGIICAECLAQDPEKKKQADTVHYQETRSILNEPETDRFKKFQTWKDHLKECATCQQIERERNDV